MIQTLAKKFFGSRNDRLIKAMKREAAKINALETTLQALSDAELAAKTTEFKSRLAQGATLNSLLVEAFAVVRETSRRVLGLRHYDVQLMGGMILHLGKIAEMHTGEGKTLVATLPVYLNALAGQGVHLVTVNDYLAKRDAEQMGKIYQFLGLSVGVIVTGLSPQERQAAYACDITYGTNNEFGFDYLRDNMAYSLEGRVQRGLNFAVVDEVDSILIDEARTPLIISGPADDSSELYVQLTQLIPALIKAEKEDAPGDYFLDEKTKQAHLTEAGHEHLEVLLVEAGLLKAGDNLYSPQHVLLMHYVNAVLRAHSLFHKDVAYIVKDGQIVIVDEHTGRAMPGRRWSDGLHQALEAKEGLKIQGENQTLASITYQNYFRLYQKLAGMTGTADTEAFEFHRTYGLEVIIVPTHHPMIRRDLSDFVFLTMKEKFDALVEEISRVHATGQPILVGTASIETSEYLSNLLNQRQLTHQVLNAKQHAREAGIIAEAGRPGAITIATNMAGRGTDIILGGNLQLEIAQAGGDTLTDAQREQLKQDWISRHDQVLAAGGLYIIGSERHESRRIDNQLRGRSGRQGDPGMSRFFLSLEDSLIRIFISPTMAGMMKKLGMGNGEPIEGKMISNQIAKAQKKVEAHHYDIRKQLLEYDDVANVQRLHIYELRRELLESDLDQIDALAKSFRDSVIPQWIVQYIPPESVEEMWDVPGLQETLQRELGLEFSVQGWLDEGNDVDALSDHLITLLEQAEVQKKQLASKEQFIQFMRNVMLQHLDRHWREHLSGLEHLRHSIGLRGYAQKDPKQEYKREAFALFQSMTEAFHQDIVGTIAKVQVTPPPVMGDASAHEVPGQQADHAHQGAPYATQANHATQVKEAVALPNGPSRVGRNDPCPCGSGKRYKQCHGALGGA